VDGSCPVPRVCEGSEAALCSSRPCEVFLSNPWVQTRADRRLASLSRRADKNIDVQEILTEGAQKVAAAWEETEDKARVHARARKRGRHASSRPSQYDRVLGCPLLGFSVGVDSRALVLVLTLGAAYLCVFHSLRW
jgi:hypothetical protein